MQKYIIKTSLYYHCITLTCFIPQKAIFREYDRYISAVRSTKRVTRWNPGSQIEHIYKYGYRFLIIKSTRFTNFSNLFLE